MVGQTKWMSFFEAASGSALGFGIAWIANFVVLPWFGYHPSIVEAFELTAIFTAISVIRVFLWRRAFNWWQLRKATRKLEGEYGW